ncbi:MAG: type II secretion system F family protein [Deltaproteobacteria bacterium]|nr:type II secretion system F family protein [Deltaproteobacteria bacterium]
METRTLIGLVALFIAAASFLTFVYLFISSRSRNTARSILGSTPLSGGRVAPSQIRQRLQDDPTGAEMDRVKRATKRKVKKKPKLTLNEVFYHAGIFTEKERREFMRIRLFAPLVLGPAAGFGVYTLAGGTDFTILGIVLGALLGLQLPKSILSRRITARQEDILYYLPLVIEQIAIGVSSSLDIGPCLQRVVSMADERESHNVVTELMRHSQFYVKSGASLEQALIEVGKASGSPELKHAFMALSQVAKHGGEISKQLQELADSVSNQRETRIEAKIKRLELEATGPVALVFAGFFIILLIGFGLQLQGAL